MTEEPKHKDMDYGIETHLESYSFVIGVYYDDEGVRVTCKGDTHFYELDSLIGNLHRTFNLDYREKVETDNQIALWFDR